MCSVGTRIEHRGDSVIVGVIGDLDLATAPDLRSQILRQLDDDERLFVVDLTACDFIDSIGLGTLIGCLRRIRGAEGHLELVVPSEKQRRIFELCDLDRILALHLDVDTALIELRASAELENRSA